MSKDSRGNKSAQLSNLSPFSGCVLPLFLRLRTCLPWSRGCRYCERSQSSHFFICCLNSSILLHVLQSKAVLRFHSLWTQNFFSAISVSRVTTLIQQHFLNACQSISVLVVCVFFSSICSNISSLLYNPKACEWAQKKLCFLCTAMYFSIIVCVIRCVKWFLKVPR